MNSYSVEFTKLTKWVFSVNCQMEMRFDNIISDWNE